MSFKKVILYQMRGHQGLISPTFYQQILCAQIPKAQKDTDALSAFCAFGIFLPKSFA